MRRVGQVIDARPDRIEEYERLHAAVWPGVLEAIHRANIRNYTIYRHGTRLFDYVGDDYAGDMAAMAADPIVQEWWTLTGRDAGATPRSPAGEQVDDHPGDFQHGLTARRRPRHRRRGRPPTPGSGQMSIRWALATRDFAVGPALRIGMQPARIVPHDRGVCGHSWTIDQSLTTVPVSADSYSAAIARACPSASARPSRGSASPRIAAPMFSSSS